MVSGLLGYKVYRVYRGYRVQCLGLGLGFRPWIQGSGLGLRV